MPEEQEDRNIMCISSLDTDKAALHPCRRLIIVGLFHTCLDCCFRKHRVGGDISQSCRLTPPASTGKCETPKNDSNDGMICEREMRIKIRFFKQRRTVSFCSTLAHCLFHVCGPLPWEHSCSTWVVSWGGWGLLFSKHIHISSLDLASCKTEGNRNRS